MGNLIGRGGGSGGGAATTLVKELISKHEVCVFSKTTCPYCVKAKDALRADAAACAPPVPVHVVELDQRTDGAALQAALAQLSGRRTVPNVYIGGESIGGGDETVAARSSGVLKQMLASARAKLDAVGPGPATAAAWSGANAEAKDAGGGGAMQTATFAAGCFWGVELHFQRVPGVLTTAVGYTQGRVEQPSYRAVSRLRARSPRAGETRSFRAMSSLHHLSSRTHQHVSPVTEVTVTCRTSAARGNRWCLRDSGTITCHLVVRRSSLNNYE